MALGRSIVTHQGLPRVERVTSRHALEEFARLPYQIYAGRAAWWPPDVQNEVDFLMRRTPVTTYLDIAPFCARRGEQMVARVSAVVNHRYNEHWNEKLGHLIHFEALEDETEATEAMLRDAMEWIRARGMTAVRTGFAAFLDYPYAIDNYDRLPSFLLRGNPAYYHCYLKDAGFETEKGQIDYTAHLDDQTLARYRGIIAAGQGRGVTYKTWRQFGFLAAIDAWTDVTNAAFARHWGWNPVTRAEVRPMLIALGETAVSDLSIIAEIDGEVVGAVFSVPDWSTMLARVRRGVTIDPDRGGGTRGALINIGVLEGARGRGIAVSMAARSFLGMAQRGMRYAGYTLVLDDNWASRRTAQSLGARITDNFITYRHDFRNS
ncbi:MAG TPA: GNAT family N-acetyltransferase [Candidatus Binataceae bacterium]|nr:GNAT family N-acetyltransferase [Candidatus Binataceae bacterium]